MPPPAALSWIRGWVPFTYSSYSVTPSLSVSSFAPVTVLPYWSSSYQSGTWSESRSCVSGVYWATMSTELVMVRARADWEMPIASTCRTPFTVQCVNRDPFAESGGVAMLVTVPVGT